MPPYRAQRRGTQPAERAPTDYSPIVDAIIGGTANLVQGIAARKHMEGQRARQADLDRIAREDRERAIANEQEDRRIAAEDRARQAQNDAHARDSAAFDRQLKVDELRAKGIEPAHTEYALRTPPLPDPALSADLTRRPGAGGRIAQAFDGGAIGGDTSIGLDNFAAAPAPLAPFPELQRTDVAASFDPSRTPEAQQKAADRKRIMDAYLAKGMSPENAALAVENPGLADNILFPNQSQSRLGAGLQQSVRLSSQFNGLPVVKNATALAESLAGMIAAAEGPPSPAGDVSLIFNFMRMQDPSSTVREGEYATAQNTAGIPDRIRNAYNKALTGEIIGEDQRADFLNQAKTKAAAQRQILRAAMDRYTAIASKYSIDPSEVVFDPYDVLLSAPPARGTSAPRHPENPYR